MNQILRSFQISGRGYTIVRLLLGIIFVLNSPVGVFDRSALTALGDNNVLLQLWSAGYVMYLVKAIELSVGLALLTNRFVPLALIVIAPIIVNIILAQLQLPGPGPMLGLLLAALAGVLALAHWPSYRHLFQSRPAYAQPPREVPLGGHSKQSA